MLTIKVIAPTEVSSRVRAILEAEPDISSLRVFAGASTRPTGDVYEADIPRESANGVISELTSSGVQQHGSIQILPIPTWVSDAGLRAEAEAPGAGADAVVWTDVVERAYDETAMTWTYVSFMILATLTPSFSSSVRWSSAPSSSPLQRSAWPLFAGGHPCFGVRFTPLSSASPFRSPS